MVTPLDFIHFHNFPSCCPFLLIKDFNWVFSIREVGFYLYVFLLDNLCGNSDTFINLGNVEDIMDGR